jgi:nicotinamidase-related amidase
MPLTRIDPVSALVVIDMQKGIVAMAAAQGAAEVTARVAELTRAFRAAGQPVVLVNVAGRAPGRTEMNVAFNPPADWAELIPELDRQPSDHTVTKMNVGAFYGTALDQILRRAGATQVVFCGISTGAGVESTARQAYDRGYNVVAVTDAMTDRDQENHRHSIERIFPRIGETASTDEVVAMVGGAG